MSEFWQQFDEPLRLPAIRSQLKDPVQIPVHLLVMPSFEDHVSYTLVLRPYRKVSDAFVLRGSGSWQTRNMTESTAPRVKDCIYSFGISDIESEIAKTWLQKWKDISIHLAPDHAIGADGTGFELDLGNDDFCSTHLRWWCDGPKTWQHAVETAKSFQQFAESLTYHQTEFELSYAVDVQWRNANGPTREEIALISRIDWYIKDMGIDEALRRLADKPHYRIGIYGRDEAIQKREATEKLRLHVTISRASKKAS